MNTELTQVPSITIAECGEKFLEKEAKLKDLREQAELLQEAREMIENQRKEINYIRTEHSLAIAAARDHIRKQNENLDSLNLFSVVWLQEFEERFAIEKQADSPAIAEHYIKHATWMANNFGRHNHSIAEVLAWIDRDNLPY